MLRIWGEEGPGARHRSVPELRLWHASCFKLREARWRSGSIDHRDRGGLKWLESAQMGSDSGRSVPWSGWSDAEATGGQIRVVKPLPYLQTIKPIRPLPPLSAVAARQGGGPRGSSLPDLADLADPPTIALLPDSAERPRRHYVADTEFHSPLSRHL